MRWITENPWPGILILAGLAVVLLLLNGRRSLHWAGLCVLLAVGLYAVERHVITTPEQLELDLNQLLADFQSENMTAISQRIAPEAAHLKATAEQGLALVSVSSGFHLKDVDVQLDGAEQSATVELRANGSLTLKASNTPVHATTRWKTLWKRQPQGWVLTEVTRLNPVTGESMGILSAQ